MQPTGLLLFAFPRRFLTDQIVVFIIEIVVNAPYPVNILVSVDHPIMTMRVTDPIFGCITTHIYCPFIIQFHSNPVGIKTVNTVSQIVKSVLKGFVRFTRRRRTTGTTVRHIYCRSYFRYQGGNGPPVVRIGRKP